MPKWARHVATAATLPPRVTALLAAQAAQEVPRWVEDSVFHAAFPKPTKDRKPVPLRSSPLSFLACIHGSSSASTFPTDLWCNFFCAVTGMPLPGLVATNAMGGLCHCGKVPDVFEDHFSCCSPHQTSIGFGAGGG